MNFPPYLSTCTWESNSILEVNSLGNKTRKSTKNARKSLVMTQISFSTIPAFAFQPIISFSILLAVQYGDDTGSIPKDTATRTRKPEIHPDLGNFFLKQRQGRKVWCRKCNMKYPSGYALWEHQVQSSKHVMCRHCMSAIDFCSKEGLHKSLEDILYYLQSAPEKYALDGQTSRPSS